MCCLNVTEPYTMSRLLNYFFCGLIMFQGFIHFYSWYRSLYLQIGKFEIDLSGRSRIFWETGGGGGVNRKRFVHTAAATANERTEKLNFFHCHRHWHYSVNTITQFHDTHFYRPQRSWAKVIFSEACVKNSIHGGGGVGLVPGGKCEIFGGGGCLKFFFFFFFQFLFPKKILLGCTPPPRKRSMRSRYASYWNAFLFPLPLLS